MNYRESLAWLYGTQTFGLKLGLENTRLLMAAAGDPHERLNFLHLAGTNGKGSTCAMLDAILRETGARVGLYTSPHLVDFRERIRLDGQMIPAEAAAEGLSLLRAAAEGWEYQPTFFEIATVLAAWWFDRAGADLVVWETGLGGRLDATNIVTPLVSVIAPIGLDHEKWLGDTLEKIAAEKAGIIKPGVPVVSAPQEAVVRGVLEHKAAAMGAALRFVDLAFDGPVALAGSHQKWNAALALAALDASGLAAEDEARRRGLAQVQWPGRFQSFGDDLVIDGAHNPPAAEVLLSAWRAAFGSAKAQLIFGAMNDKDVPALLHILRGISDEVWLVPLQSSRSASVDVLRGMAEAAGFSATHADDLPVALAAARAKGPTLVTGSLFLAGETLALLQGREAPLPSDQ